MIVHATRIVLLEIDNKFATGLLLVNEPQHIRNMLKAHDDNTIGFTLTLNALRMLDASETDLRGKVVDINAHICMGRTKDGRSAYKTYVTSVVKVGSAFV